MWLEIPGLITLVLAMVGCWLNNRMDIRCFWLWIASNLISLSIHAVIGPWTLMARDVGFIILAIVGLIKWAKTRRECEKLSEDLEKIKRALEGYPNRKNPK